MSTTNFKTRSAARTFSAHKKSIGHTTKVIDNGADSKSDRWSVQWFVAAAVGDIDFKSVENQAVEPEEQREILSVGKTEISPFIGVDTTIIRNKNRNIVIMMKKKSKLKLD